MVGRLDSNQRPPAPKASWGAASEALISEQFAEVRIWCGGFCGACAASSGERARAEAIDVAQMVEFSGVFEPLREPAFFAKASVNAELGTVCWPNNTDLDSDVLFAKVAGVQVPEYASEKRRA